MEGYHVDNREQLLERGDGLCRPQRHQLQDIVKVHLHTERLGQNRELGADVAIPDNTQLLATNLVAVFRNLVPHSAVHFVIAVTQLASQEDDLGKNKLG